ncbi:MAG: hypothetical protein ACRD3J_09270, partial [Thermoanaerobaculia bacterium]
RAIYTLRSNAANDPLGLSIGSAERIKWVTTLEQGGTASGADSDILSFVKDAGRLGVGSDVLEILTGGWSNQGMKREPANHLVEYQLEGLGGAASRLAPLEGQKHLLVFTEGFDSTNVTDIKVRNQSVASQNPFATFGMSYQQAAPDTDPHLLDIVKKMHETFVSAGVTLDSIDIKGVRHTFDSLENDALYMLSRGTGGRVIVNRNDLSEAMTTVMQAQQVAYVLGFRPGEKKRGQISVRVNGLPRGAEVSYREGFGYVPQTSKLDTLQLADIVLNDVPQSGVSLNSGVTPSEGGAQVAVSFANAEVVPQLVEGSPNIQILLYIFDEHGVAVGFKSKQMSFNGGARVSSGYVTLREPFELPKGKYTAKVLLRITGTRSLGFVRRDFTVE